MKFRKKPVEVEAVRFTGENWAEMHAFCGHRPLEGQFSQETGAQAYADIFNPAGTYATWPDGVEGEVWDWLHRTHVGVLAGQWVIRGTEGEFYPCEDDGTGTAPLNYEPA